jgi:hypothetical protein
MIDKLQTLLHQTILGDGGLRASCVANPANNTAMNVILLFYRDDLSTNIKTGKYANSLFLSQGIEIATRDNDYNRSRSLCLKAIKYLGQNREQENISIWVKDSVPTYKGIDDTGGNVFSFTVLLRGIEPQ